MHEVLELPRWQAAPRLARILRSSLGPVVVDLGFVYLPLPCRLCLPLPLVVLCLVALCVLVMLVRTPQPRVLPVPPMEMPGGMEVGAAAVSEA